MILSRFAAPWINTVILSLSGFTLNFTSFQNSSFNQQCNKDCFYFSETTWMAFSTFSSTSALILFSGLDFLHMRYWQTCSLTGLILSPQISLKFEASTANGHRSNSGSSLSRCMMVEYAWKCANALNTIRQWSISDKVFWPPNFVENLTNPSYFHSNQEKDLIK